MGVFSPQACADILNGNTQFAPETLARARAGIDTLVAARIGGDCWSAPAAVDAVSLVVAPPVLGEAFDRMIAAVGDNGSALLIPVQAAKPVRETLLRLAVERGMTPIEGPVDVWSLIDSTRTLFTVDDDLGFLALLKGIRVRCFGNPFYAGYGLTEDDSTIPARSRACGVEELFAAACLSATEYRDPFTDTVCGFEGACSILADWRPVSDTNRGIAVCVGMSFWKQRRIADMLRSDRGAPEFHKTTAAAIAAARRRGGGIAVWAAREPADLAPAASEAGIAVVRIEDGFVRSVGLGADFTQAASVVLDRTGIYFDPAKPSGLENLLMTARFNEALTARAGRLIDTLVTRGITKYNTGAPMPAIDVPTGRRTIFVPGQVEDDRSVATGGAGIYSNLELLRRVRTLNPDAFIIYKPHPDVDAGHRLGTIPDDEARRFADLIVRGVSTAAIIPAVDEIHTLTSLAGFEALIRRRKVVTYGQPFYSGWGLTTDLAPVARRTRKLSLEELIAGSLVIYPRYFDPVTRLPCGPEILIERLSHPELWRPGVLVVLRRMQGELTRRIGNLRTKNTSHVGTANSGKRQKHVKPA
jgi:capsular polysaccharide export protein